MFGFGKKKRGKNKVTSGVAGVPRGGITKMVLYQINIPPPTDSNYLKEYTLTSTSVHIERLNLHRFKSFRVHQ